MVFDANILPITINLNFSTPTNRAGDNHEARPSRLSNVPPLGPGSSVFSYLSCHTKASEFHGRDDEVAELLRWAQSADSHPIRFVTGPGGAGKTRLAIKVGEGLIEQGWSAQFISLENSDEDTDQLTIECAEGKQGTLLLLDYPEAYFSKIDGLLKAFAHHFSKRQQLRLLLLTRATQSDWAERIGRCKARNLTDERFITLAPSVAPITPRAGMEIINSTMQAIAPIRDHRDGTLLRPVTEEAVAAWMKEDASGLHKLPLFLVAAGVHSAMYPDEEAVCFSGLKIIEALVDRETDRLRSASLALGAQEDTLPRFLAASTIAGRLAWKDIESNQRLRILCNAQSPQDIKGPMIESGWLVNDTLVPITPDIVGAGFVYKVLKDARETHELTWEAIRATPQKSIQAIDRLSYDMTYTLGYKTSPAKWLAQAVDGNTSRCRVLDYLESADESLFLGILPLTVSRTMLPTAKSPEQRARRLHNLSKRLAEVGDTLGALEPIQEAIEIYQSLTEEQPRRIPRGLVMSLSSLSNRLADIGEIHAALEPARLAVDILHSVKQENSQQFLHVVAISLSNLGNRLADIGAVRTALEPTQQAVDIYQTLAQQQPHIYSHYLAGNLGNLGVRLAKVGDARAALKPAQEAVDIYQALAEEQPQRYLPYLAGSLCNVASWHAELGDAHAALEPARSASNIYQKLAEEHPNRFLPDMATNLSNLGVIQADLGNLNAAFESVRSAVDIRRSLAKNQPQRFLPDLGMSLGALGNVLKASGDVAGAKAAFAEGMEIMTPLAKQFPGSPSEALHSSLKRNYDVLDQSARMSPGKPYN